MVKKYNTINEGHKNVNDYVERMNEFKTKNEKQKYFWGLISQNNLSFSDFKIMLDSICDIKKESITENTQAKGLDIKNEYTKLINDPTLKEIDLGLLDDVSDTDIKNIKQTYKNSTVRVLNGHYMLSVYEKLITFKNF